MARFMSPKLIRIAALAGLAGVAALLAQPPVGAQLPAGRVGASPVPTATTPVPAEGGPVTAESGDGPLITITADRSDGMYEVGDKAKFTIEVKYPRPVAAGARITVRMMSLGAGILKDFDHHTTDAPLVVEGSLAQPGVLMIHAVPDRNRPMQFRAEAAAGFAIREIRPAQTAPDDFMAFWLEQRGLLARIPTGLTVTPEEKYSDESILNLRVSFNTLEGKRFHGWLDRPRKPGKYPALIRVLGGAVMAIPAGPTGGGYSFAKRYGCLSFTASVHDLPLDNPNEFYRRLETREGPLHQYWNHGLESPATHFYRSVIAGLLRAIDFLTAQEDWDGRTLIVLGGSQGGAAAYWMAGLDSRVTAMVAKVPAFTELGVLSTADPRVRYFKDPDTPDTIRSRAYYDPVFFARYVQANSLVIEGLMDGNIRGGIAAFNSIPHERKRLAIDPKAGHTMRDSKILNTAQDEFFREILK